MFSRADAKKDSDKIDGKGLRALLLRTGTWDWTQMGMQSAWPGAEECLNWKTADIDEVTSGYAALAARLQGAFPARAQKAPAEPPAQAGWVRATATGLAFCPDVQKDAGVTPDRIGDLVDRDVITRAIALYAGRAKDGAMDARLLIGSFGYFLISRVLDGLRDRVRDLPPDESEALLCDFAPLLVIVGQLQSDQAARRDEGKDEEATLLSALESAQAERDRAAAALRVRKGEAAPEDLRTLAEPTPPTPPRKGGRRGPR